MRVIRCDLEKAIKSKKADYYSGDAKRISPQLLLFNYEKNRGFGKRYHVIHYPTGLVVADIDYTMVSMVKKSFEHEQWTLKGENTLYRQQHTKKNDTFSFEMTCRIRYELKDSCDD